MRDLGAVRVASKALRELGSKGEGEARAGHLESGFGRRWGQYGQDRSGERMYGWNLVLMNTSKWRRKLAQALPIFPILETSSHLHHFPKLPFPSVV